MSDETKYGITVAGSNTDHDCVRVVCVVFWLPVPVPLSCALIQYHWLTPLKLYWTESLNNNYFFVSDNLKNGRFHQHLRELFAPLVVRYVDLMESSIAQSIHKGFEKERWELKGWVFSLASWPSGYRPPGLVWLRVARLVEWNFVLVCCSLVQIPVKHSVILHFDHIR